MKRPQITKKDVQKILDAFSRKYFQKLSSKGYGIFYSSHETFGKMMEEVNEVNDEVRSGNKKRLREELMDVAVIAIHGIASIDSGEMET